MNMEPFITAKTKAHADHNLELLKSVVTAGEAVLKTLLLINGGAAVAVLAFLGNVLSKDPATGVALSVPKVATGLLRFGAAVGIIGVGALFRFLSIWFSRTKHTAAELAFAGLAVLAGFASMWLFVCGCLWVAAGMR